jgi:hypothetical protein
MPRINVLEVRYHLNGTWGGPIAEEFANEEPRDWADATPTPVTKTPKQSRVVPYERVEVREGREPPDSGRWVLGRHGEQWDVVRYVYVGDPYWTSVGGHRALAPDDWRELPGASK